MSVRAGVFIIWAAWLVQTAIWVWMWWVIENRGGPLGILVVPALSTAHALGMSYAVLCEVSYGDRVQQRHQ